MKLAAAFLYGVIWTSMLWTFILSNTTWHMRGDSVFGLAVLLILVTIIPGIFIYVYVQEHWND